MLLMATSRRKAQPLIGRSTGQVCLLLLRSAPYNATCCIASPACICQTVLQTVCIPGKIALWASDIPDQWVGIAWRG